MAASTSMNAVNSPKPACNRVDTLMVFISVRIQKGVCLVYDCLTEY
jgi:hypothetical protein